MPQTVLVSAGEASGDLYASELVRALARLRPDLRFFGCAGPRMQAAGVEAVVDAHSLAVVGLAEVVAHIPRIYGEFRKLIRAAEDRRPAFAILADSPDFNLRVAKRLHRLKIPVLYLVAPQVWAWREGRVKQIRRDVARLLCIFPFEEPWFRERGVEAVYIGHPLTRIVRPSRTRFEFFKAHGLDPARPLVTILPGSRTGEVARHIGPLNAAAAALARRTDAQTVMALSPAFVARAGERFFRERKLLASIQVIEGEAWDAIASADVCLAASGTVTVEAALLGSPMVTFYRVSPLSWKLGRRLVRAPFLTMVNLIAGREIVPELMQHEATGEHLSGEVIRLLENTARREQMKREIARVAELLSTETDPMDRAARIALEFLN